MKLFKNALDYHLFLFCLFSLTLFVLYRGQDINFDLFNYHFYDGYAVLNGRMNIDIHPAHMQTYHTPLFDIPFYLIVKTFNFPGYIYAIFSGLFQALTWFFSYLIFSHLLKTMVKDERVLAVVSFLFSTFATLTALYIDLLGLTYGDAFITPFYMLGLYCLLQCEEKKVFFAGIFLGMAIGLKVTNLVSLTGHVFFSFILFGKEWKKYIFFFFGLMLGFLAMGGAWHLYLWIKFGSPLFPLFNSFFHSPWVSDYSFNPLDSHQQKGNRFDFFYLLIELLNVKRPIIHHYPLRDARFLLAFSSSLGILLFSLLRRFRDRLALYFAASWFLSYYLWTKTGIVYRYYIMGDLLAFLVVFFFVKNLLIEKQKLALIVVGILGLGIFSYQKSGYYDLIPWQNSNYFGLEATGEYQAIQKATVLMAGPDTSSYVIPYFHPSNKFIRIQGTMDFFDMLTEKFQQKIKAEVQAAQDPLYAMFVLKSDGTLGWPPHRFSKGEKHQGLENDIHKVLMEYGLELTPQCLQLTSFFHNIDKIELCKLKRIHL